LVKIGIIGGSGLDNPDILKEPVDVEVSTPFGKPSSRLKQGKISGVDVVILARHGREHTIPPTQVNFRANIKALKDAGCTHILATTAVGSLRQEIGRGDFVILDKFIDFTRHRQVTFQDCFEPHKPSHCAMPDFRIARSRSFAAYCAATPGTRMRRCNSASPSIHWVAPKRPRKSGSPCSPTTRSAKMRGCICG